MNVTQLASIFVLLTPASKSLKDIIVGLPEDPLVNGPLEDVKLPGYPGAAAKPTGLPGCPGKAISDGLIIAGSIPKKLIATSKYSE